MVKEARSAGCRIKPACELIEIDIRTMQRWQKETNLQDKRSGPNTMPTHALTDVERARIIEVANSPEYCDQPPSQIIPNLADKGIYIGSESSFYRVLKERKLLQHRLASRPKQHNKPEELVAIKPNQLWSWDITYLLSNIRGMYFYLYLFIDIFSRKIVGFDVYDEQTAEHAAAVVSNAYIAEGVSKNEVTLHSDNGKPMKGYTMLAMLQNLGIAPSFSRPSVSDDNPFSEAIFKTLKYSPKYPSKPFTTAAEALAWVEIFVHWYNNIHLHSGINFVTANERHQGNDQEILEKRINVYELARQQNPNRWSGNVRNWDRVDEVYLNPKNTSRKVAA